MNAQLKIDKNACYLNVQVEQPDPELITGDKRLGVDLGINNIAVCSDNTFWESGTVKAVKGKYRYLRFKASVHRHSICKKKASEAFRSRETVSKGRES